MATPKISKTPKYIAVYWINVLEVKFEMCYALSNWIKFYINLRHIQGIARYFIIWALKVNVKKKLNILFGLYSYVKLYQIILM